MMLSHCDFGLITLSEDDSPDSTSSASASCSMHAGQNSAAPENSLPQLGQTRLSSVFMGLAPSDAIKELQGA